MNKNKTDKSIVMLTQWLGIALLAGIFIWGAVYLVKAYRYEQTNDAQIDAYLSPINAKVGGYIHAVYYKDNQKVAKGDTLAVIEADEYRLKRDAAAAELLSTKAKIPILDAGEQTQRKSMAVIEAQLAGAWAKLNQQQKEYERYKNLLADASTTQQKFDNISASLSITQSDYNQTKASLQVAASKLNDFKVQHKALQAEIQIKEALLKRQELDIRYTVITAPFDGQIGKKKHPGRTAAASRTDLSLSGQYSRRKMGNGQLQGNSNRQFQNWTEGIYRGRCFSGRTVQWRYRITFPGNRFPLFAASS
ncbi:hypothetical protein AAFH68_24490 [Flavobacterium sp. CGRL1]